MSEESTPLDWRVSTFCGTSACVEVAIYGNDVFLRDSARPTGPRLEFDRLGWSGFMAALKAGQTELWS